MAVLVTYYQGRNGDSATETVTGAGDIQALEGLTTPSASGAQAAVDADMPLSPSFDVVRISRGGTGVIAGRAAPGSAVEVYADKTRIGTALADARGEWVMILDQPLESGPAELSLVALRAGEEPSRSGDVVVVAVPDRTEDAEGQGNGLDGVVAILSPRDGQGPSRVLQKPGLLPVGEIGDSLTLDTLDYSAGGVTTISGRAVPRAGVALYLDNNFVGNTKADDEGRWSLAPSEPVAAGRHILRIDQVIADGDVELRIEQPFETGAPFDRARQTAKVRIQPGNNLWHIARQIYGAGIRYTMIFQENAGQIRDPDLIYPGQLFILPSGRADGQGDEREASNRQG